MDERTSKDANNQSHRLLKDQVGVLGTEVAGTSTVGMSASAQKQLSDVLSVQIEGELLVKLSFSFEKNQVFQLGGLNLARAEIVDAYTTMAESALQTARAQMAKDAQVEPDLLVVAVGLDRAHLEVSLLLPAGTVEQVKLERLRQLGRLAGESMNSALSQLSTPQLGISEVVQIGEENHAPDQGVEGQTAKSAPELDCGPTKLARTKRNPFDRVARALASMLAKKNRPGEFTVSVTSSDEDEPQARHQVPRVEVGEPSKPVYDPQEKPVTLEVLSLVNQQTRVVKEEGATARVRASFATDGLLPAQLRLLEGGHRATVMARRLKSEGEEDAVAPELFVTSLVTLDRLWGGELGGLRTLRQVLDGLESLVERAEPSSRKGSKSERRRS